MTALLELEHEWSKAQTDPAFDAELKALLANVVGRPTPLYRA